MLKIFMVWDFVVYKKARSFSEVDFEFTSSKGKYSHWKCQKLTFENAYSSLPMNQRQVNFRFKNRNFAKKNFKNFKFR